MSMDDEGTKINVRVSEQDLIGLKKLVPAKYMNVSDAVRTAIRILLKGELK